MMDKETINLLKPFIGMKLKNFTMQDNTLILFFKDDNYSTKQANIELSKPINIRTLYMDKQ